jgi:hypothetical protein
MRIAGIEVPSGAVADLALCLHNAGERALSEHVGIAVDTGRRELGLGVRQRETILRVLEACPDSLAPLHAVLLAEHVGRQRDRV